MTVRPDAGAPSGGRPAAAPGQDEVVSSFVLERNRILGDRWFSDLEPAEARDAFERLSEAHRSHGLPRPEVGAVVDETLDCPSGPVRVRVYSPARTDGAPAPAIVYFHGGGFVFGSVDSFDEVTRLICRSCDAVGVSVDYPLAPEHPFPEPLTACVESVAWVTQNIAAFGGNPDAVLVMGDSAGANLAAATAVECVRRGVRLVGQVLLYGTFVQVDLAAEAGVPEWADRDQQFGPTTAAAAWYWWTYAPTAAAARHPRASVLLEQDLSGAPPALITAGSQDTFRVEGEAYGRRLRESGVDAEVCVFPDVGHGYIAQGWWPQDERDPAAHAAAMETLDKVTRMAHA